MPAGPPLIWHREGALCLRLQLALAMAPGSECTTQLPAASYRMCVCVSVSVVWCVLCPRCARVRRAPHQLPVFVCAPSASAPLPSLLNKAPAHSHSPSHLRLSRVQSVVPSFLSKVRAVCRHSIRRAFFSPDDKDKRNMIDVHLNKEIRNTLVPASGIAASRPHWPSLSQTRSSGDCGRKPLDSLFANHGPIQAYEPARGTGSSHVLLARGRQPQQQPVQRRT